MSHSATARTDDSSNLVTSDDPSTNASASLGSKLAGDVKGAVQGVVGGAQAALGTTIRNEKMAEEGFEKMRAGTSIHKPNSPLLKRPILTSFQRTRD